jgi:hypothetical protein
MSSNFENPFGIFLGIWAAFLPRIGFGSILHADGRADRYPLVVLGEIVERPQYSEVVLDCRGAQPGGHQLILPADQVIFGDRSGVVVTYVPNKLVDDLGPTILGLLVSPCLPSPIGDEIRPPIRI